MASAEIRNGLDIESKRERDLERTRRGVGGFLRIIDRLVTKNNHGIEGNEEYSTPFKPIRLGEDSCEVQAMAFYDADRKIVRGTLHIMGTLKGKPVNAYRNLSIDDLPDDKTLNIRLKFASAVSRKFSENSSEETSTLPEKAISN